MYISDLSEGDVVTVNAHDEKNRKILIKTKVTTLPTVERLKLETYLDKADILHYCVLEHMTDNDASINFNGATKPVYMTLSAVHGGKALFWNSCKIIRIHAGKETYHVAVNQRQGIEIDRRQDYRLQLNHEGTFTINNGTVEHKVLVRDISESGMGLKMKSKNKVVPGDVVTVSFVTKKYDPSKRDTDYFSNIIPAKVVRVIATTNNEVLVGCRMSRKMEEVKALIYSEQRNQSMHRRG